MAFTPTSKVVMGGLDLAVPVFRAAPPNLWDARLRAGHGDREWGGEAHQ